MPLSAEEEDLLDFALGTLPGWFSDEEQRDLAIEGGMAKQMGAAWDTITYWFDQTLIGEAVDATGDDPDWLQQHAMDRDTRRADGETDPVLRVRLQKFPDALTRATLISIAQDLVDAAGVSGDVAMVELRRDRAYLTTRAPMTGTGGTFAVAGTVVTFTPDELPWPRPPYQDPSIVQVLSSKLVISGAASAANDGTHDITGVVLDAAQYTDASAVAEADPTVTWRVDWYDSDGNLLTAGAGRADAYLSRGYRCGDTYPAIILILPFGSDAALGLAVAEAIRQRKAAGVRVYVERRLSP